MTTTPHSDTVRAAIVGLGWIAMDPPQDSFSEVLGPIPAVSHAEVFSRIPEVELVAICDSDDTVLSKCRDAWSNRWPGLRGYSSAEDLMDSEDLDLLSIATPDHLHADLVIDAARRGVPAIVCEKPIATSALDARRVLEALRDTATLVLVNYTRRWKPDFLRAKSLIEQGACGRLSHIIIRGGGPRAMLFRNGCHYLDLASWYAASDPARVWGQLEPGDKWNGDILSTGGSHPDSEPGYDCVVTYQNGVVAHIADRKEMLKERSVELVGDQGRISVSEEDGLSLFRQGEFERSLQRTRISSVGSYEGLEAGVRELLKSLATGGTVSSSATSAAQVTLITDAILASHRQGNVTIDVGMEGAFLQQESHAQREKE